MKHIITFLSIIAFCSAFAQDTRDVAQRYVQSSKEEASYMLTLVCSLDGIFQRQERIFYFRAPQDLTDFGTISMTSSNADGAGRGYGFSVRAEPRNTSVEIEVSTYWTSRSAHGKCEVTLLVPYFESKKGKDAGFGYDCTWKKLK